MGLVLRAAESAGPWRWRLTDEESGRALAGHEVVLDPGSDEVAAFAGLYEYVRERAAPDRRVDDEERLAAWAGRNLLGETPGRPKACGSANFSTLSSPTAISWRPPSRRCDGSWTSRTGRYDH